MNLGCLSGKNWFLIKEEIYNAQIKDKNLFINENIDIFQGLGKFNVTRSIKIDANAEPTALSKISKKVASFFVLVE